jgi:hypothetical protein
MVATYIVVVAPAVVANGALDVAAQVLLACEIEVPVASVDILIGLVLIVIGKDVVDNDEVDVSLVLAVSDLIVCVEMLWMVIVVAAPVEAVEETIDQYLSTSR